MITHNGVKLTPVRVAWLTKLSQSGILGHSKLPGSKPPHPGYRGRPRQVTSGTWRPMVEALLIEVVENPPFAWREAHQTYFQITGEGRDALAKAEREMRERGEP